MPRSSPLLHVRSLKPRANVAISWRVAVVALALVLAAYSAAAADPDLPPTVGKPAPNLFFETISPKLGLTQADIVTAVQTRDGYLWVGSGSGLARFDGVRFVSFRLSNTPAFLSQLVNCLLEDSSGALWIGTERGVLRYTDGTFERMGAEEASVRSLAQDRSGRVWCGTFGHGLFVFEEGKLRAVRDQNLPSEFISSVWVDTTDQLWIGFSRANGVTRLADGKFQRFFANGLLASEVQAITGSSDGAVWFGSHRDGLVRWKDGVGTSIPVKTGEVNLQIYELRPARDGGVWVMTDILLKIAPGDRPTLLSVPVPLADRPGTVCEDREGGTWICGRSSGLIYGRELPYRTLSTDNGLPGNTVRSVSEDAFGTLWFSVFHGGLVELSVDGRMTVHTEADGLPSNDPEAVLAASDGSVWVGFTRGLYQLRDGVGHLVPSVPGVGSIFERSDGTIWVGTSHNGVFRGRDGKFAHVDLKLGPDLDYITSFAEAADGTMYIGSWNDGLIKVSGEKAEAVNRKTGLPSNEVRALHVDRSGRLWVGMRGRGLAVWESGQWLNPDRLTEAVGDQVNAIEEDNRGQLWLGTPGGVIWAPIAQLLDAARNGLAPPDLRIAEISDTHPAFVVRSGKQPIAWRTRKGELLFATRRGLFGVDPARVEINRVPPPVCIERLTFDGATLAPRGDHRVPAGVREISIDYTAPSFVGSSRMAFRYKVEGYDSDWVAAGTRRTAIYTNLPPHEYVFRVKACNGDGVWNEVGATLAFTVEPFFWQTWWFALTALVIFTSGTVAIARYVSFRRLQLHLRTLAQQAALDRERTRIARDIHDDIGNRLTTISLLSKLAFRDHAAPEKIRKHAQAIGTTVRQVTDSLDEIVWAVNPRNDTLPHLISYLGQFAVDFMKTAGIECDIEVPDHPSDYSLAADVRHNLFLVVKETLNNVVRHSGATRVTFGVEFDQVRLTLFVADNGRGFEKKPEGAGADGLRNMEQRMTEIGGTFSIESSLGKGTRVTLSYPVTQKAAP